MAAPAFNRGNERRFLAADKGACTQPDVDVKVEGCAHDARAQETLSFGLADGHLQPFDGQGIFAAHVDVAFFGPHGVGGQGHAFQNAMGVAFQNAAVHERAGVAFVAVADDVALGAFRFGHRDPFEAGGIATAAPTAQAAANHFVNHLAGGLISVMAW
jgi:hypothetical protein